MSTTKRWGRRQATILVVIAALLAAACTSSRPEADPSAVTTTTTTADGPSTTVAGIDANTQTAAAASQLGIKLGEGSSLTAAPEPIPVVDGIPIDPNRIAEILARLPDWGPGSTQTPFNWPTQSLTPPRTGATVDVPFPNPTVVAPPEVPVGNLEVLRFQPEGDVPIAGFVSITFNQPMVPIGTVAAVNATAPPATITPAVPGAWTWIGTKTARFDVDSDVVDRLPMATDFRVEIPAGTTSQTGGVLAAAVSFAFSTPALTMQATVPGNGSESVVLNPVIITTFDQRIDLQAVLAAAVVTAGTDRVEMRLASAQEIAADQYASSVTAMTPDGRWLAMVPTSPLPTDTSIKVEFPVGTPSAEGPKTTTAAQSFSFRTYGPFEVDRVDCAWGTTCVPGTDIQITMSNEIDLDTFDQANITIEPELAGQLISVSGSMINIRGATLGRTKYTITLPGLLGDVFGQTLGQAVTVDKTIGDAQPEIRQFSQPLVTLDPLDEGQSLNVVTINHDNVRLRVFPVQPSDWSAFILWSQNSFDQNGLKDPTWTAAVDRTLDVASKQDQQTETKIDLGEVLGGTPGHVVVIVESTTTYSQNDPLYWMNRPAVAWVQSTKIGLDAIADNDEVLAWATDLASGAPLSGLAITTLGTQQTLTTDAAGLARAELSSTTITALLATRDDDVAMLPAGFYGEGWRENQRIDETRWFVFDDRGVYRPGETVSVKGWVRNFTAASDFQIKAFAPGATLSYRAYDAYGNEIATGDAEVNAVGGFDFTFDIVAGANLGYGYVEMSLSGSAGGGTAHGFQIQEFRRPEFEVTTRVESPQPQLSRNPATLAAAATYYAGGPLAAAPVTWTVSTGSASYSPPNWDDYTFGVWTPWWYEDFGGYGGFADSSGSARALEPCCFPGSPQDVETFTGVTDSNGDHFLQVGFEVPEGGFPDLAVMVNAAAAVQDVNRQTWSSSTSLLVHPGAIYVGIRSDQAFVRQGEDLVIEAIATDIDGNVAAGRDLTIVAKRLEWTTVRGVSEQVAVDTQTCEVTSAAEAVTCTFEAKIGGQYTIVATVADDSGATSRSEFTRWVSGGDAIPSRSVQQEELILVPNKKDYAGGETAEILVQSPFASGEGLATIVRGDIRSTIRFQVVENSAIVAIPIDDADVPNVDVSIEVVGAAQRLGDDGTPAADAPARPAFAVGALSLRVPPVSRTLDIALSSPDAVEPGAETSVGVKVTDASGQPVAGAELAVVVVDEAVLAVSGYQLSDPLDLFYSPIYPQIWATYGRSSIVLSDPMSLAARDELAPASTDAAATAEEAPAASLNDGAQAPVPTGAPAERVSAADQFAGGAAAQAVEVRSNFDALAVFEPEVTTAADGTATIAVPLPDNLTRYRVMVVAASGEDRFGSGESNITARLPLMIRPSAPRFLNFGDTFEMPAIVQNQTDQAIEVDVVLQASNLSLTGDAGKRITVPANDRVEVRFPMAADQAGTAAYRFVAVSGDHSDAAEGTLPVYTPATTEAFATYGVVDGSGAEAVVGQPLIAPTEVIPQFGGLDVTTSSTALQALTDAVLYISEYPYASSDALAARIIAVSALRDVLDAFDAEGLPSVDALNTQTQRDITNLIALQNGDGGFGFWAQFRPSEPFNTVQAAHALVIAKATGFTVPENNLQMAMSYLQSIEQYYPATYSQQTRTTISAYALHVRSLNGDRDTAKALDLYNTRKNEMELDAVAWLWPVIDDAAVDAEIERLLANRAVETAGAANFSTSYSDADYVLLASDRRTDGIILDALISKRPDSDLIPKVVTGLLGNQIKGRWNNIQENSFILLALKHYFDVFEAQTPEFVARVWLGEQFAGEKTFSGRSTDRVRISVPMTEVQAAGDSTLVLAKEGSGRLYYRLGLRYAPSDLSLEPLERGFVVSRSYEAVDDPGDVVHNADGSWTIKPGARVRVKVSMVAESQRTIVALIDPLPAGLEILNPAAAITEAVPPEAVPESSNPYEGYYWWGTWYEHQNMRDDRAEAFTSLLPAGTYDYSYVARATTPGRFVVPPSRAEEIYAPETFGRGATDIVIVG